MGRKSGARGQVDDARYIKKIGWFNQGMKTTSNSRMETNDCVADSNEMK